jgi:hypothetical protein
MVKRKRERQSGEDREWGRERGRGILVKKEWEREVEW